MRALSKEQQSRDYEELLLKNAAAIQRVLQTEPGQQMMEVLKGKFNRGDMVGDTANQTYYNLGARAVVLYIEQMATIRQT